MREIFESQKDFYKKGYTQSVTYREAQLKKLKEVLKSSEDELLYALEVDLGKHPRESYITELFMVYKSINHTLKHLSKWAKDKKVRTPLLLKPGASYVRNHPFGVSLIMSAYNYPLLLSIDPIIGAIAGGNTVMLALSKNSVETNKVLIKILNESFESNYLFAFETDRHINQDILRYDFDKIFFTGSEKVGRIVLEHASHNLCDTTLELGGKSPAFVLRDAKLKIAADNIVYSKVLNAGQTCIASDYVMVDELIADDLILEMIKSNQEFYPDFNEMPKIINMREYERLCEYYEADKKYCVNKPSFDEKSMRMSLVLLKVDLKDVDALKSMETEIFGPILPIVVYDDLDEALRYCDSKAAPLALYVFGRRKQKINRVLDNLSFGGSSVNATILHMVNENLPFSGFKQSGLGSYHGEYSYECFTVKQGVYKRGFLQLHKVIYPPYRTSRKKK